MTKTPRKRQRDEPGNRKGENTGIRYNKGIHVDRALRPDTDRARRNQR